MSKNTVTAGAAKNAYGTFPHMNGNLLCATDIKTASQSILPDPSGLLCAIDTETTGLDPEADEILEIAILPMDSSLGIHPDLPPFTMQMKPEKMGEQDAWPPGMSKQKYADYKLYGVESHRGGDLLIEWFNSLGLPPGKKIVAVAHNWTFDHKMIWHWLGPKNYNEIFHWMFRDTMSIAQMMNDIANFKLHVDTPHPKMELGATCALYGVNLMNAHSANADALATMELYKKFVERLTI